MKLKGFESVRILEKFLLVFDDSREHISNIKEFVRLATAGRNKEINVIYTKHNLINNVDGRVRIFSHIILFNSPCEFQQFDSLRMPIECNQISEKLL